MKKMFGLNLFVVLFLLTGSIWAQDNKGVVLDGSNGFKITKTGGGDLGFSDNKITISFWAKFDPAIAKKGVVGTNASQLFIVFNFSDALGYFIRGNNNKGYSFGPYNENKWQHWCFVRDKSTQKLDVYIDGVKQAPTQGSRRDLAFSITELFLGKDNRGNSYKGALDEFYLWNTALTAAQIAQVYAGTVVKPDNMLCYLNFNDTSDLAKNLKTNSGMTVEPYGTFTADSSVTSPALIPTPAYGVEVVKVGTELKWTVDFEDAVVSYNVEKHVNGVWTKVTTVAAKGEIQAKYSVVVGDGEFRITTVDGSGFTQSFAAKSTNQIFINLNAGWNLVSVPFEGADIDALKAEGPIWAWDGTAYKQATEVNALQGVWVFSATAHQVTVSGTKAADDTVNLIAGWNLVGPAENCKVPADVYVYSWEKAYQQILENSAGLIQGHGYWMFTEASKTVKLGL